MKRRISVLVAFIGVVGLLGLSPAAQATHDQGDKGKKDGGNHESYPTPPFDDLASAAANGNVLAECVVTGTVSIGNSKSQGAETGGVAATQVSHNHYRFQETLINCIPVPEVGNPAFGGAFAVDATGATDGPNAIPDLQSGTHGESDAEGWSHSHCYAGVGTCLSWWGDKKMSFNDIYDGTNTNNGSVCRNCGEISITGAVTESHSTDNWVKFRRVGNQVVAWGVLIATAGPKTGTVACFLTELDFIPENLTVPPKAKLDAARLDGTATVWDAKNDKKNCRGEKGDKKKEDT